jgi:hypothetical protein
MRADRSPVANGQRRRRPRRVTALAVVLVVMGTAACGDIEDESMCSVYGDFLDVRAELAEVDPEQETAADATELAEDYLDTVTRLQETADGRFGTELDRLESAVDDVLRTLDSLDDDADYATWAPLVEDSLENVADAAVSVEDAIEPQCPDTGDEG